MYSSMISVPTPFPSELKSTMDVLRTTPSSTYRQEMMPTGGHDAVPVTFPRHGSVVAICKMLPWHQGYRLAAHGGHANGYRDDSSCYAIGHMKFNQDSLWYVEHVDVTSSGTPDIPGSGVVRFKKAYNSDQGRYLAHLLDRVSDADRETERLFRMRRHGEPDDEHQVRTRGHLWTRSQRQDWTSAQMSNVSVTSRMDSNNEIIEDKYLQWQLDAYPTTTEGTTAWNTLNLDLDDGDGLLENFHINQWFQTTMPNAGFRPAANSRNNVQPGFTLPTGITREWRYHPFFPPRLMTGGQAPAFGRGDYVYNPMRDHRNMVPPVTWTIRANSAVDTITPTGPFGSYKRFLTLESDTSRTRSHNHGRRDNESTWAFCDDVQSYLDDHPDQDWEQLAKYYQWWIHEVRAPMAPQAITGQTHPYPRYASTAQEVMMTNFYMNTEFLTGFRN